jgi:hypothetical protein
MHVLIHALSLHDYHLKDPLDDSDEEDDALPVLGKGKGNESMFAISSFRPASNPAYFQHARSPSNEELVPNKHQAHHEVKPNDSDADSEDQDELTDNAAKSENMADAHSSPEGRVADEDEEGDEEEGEEEDKEAAEEEVSKTPPKKAAKGAAAGKAKAAPAAAPALSVSPLFAGPRESHLLVSFPSSLFYPSSSYHRCGSGVAR